MSAVFLGASQLGYECCKALLDAGKEIERIYTMPRDFTVKSSDGVRQVSNVLHADLVELGATYGVPVTAVTGSLRDHRDELGALHADLMVVVGWYHLIPADILSLPHHGVVGIHASLLPQFRGNAPLVWAMIEGARESGVTLFHFDEGIDTGDIVGQRSFPILSNDTIANVLAKARDSAVELLLDNFDALLEGAAPRVEQSRSSSKPYPPRTPDDGQIDWSWPAERIAAFIRAQTRPYPGAFTIIHGKRVTIWDATIIDGEEPGQ